MPDDVDGAEHPGTTSDGVIIPEIVRPGTPSCRGCASGTPHRDAKGHISPGHSMNPGGGRPKGSKNRTTLLAIDEMRRHVLPAVRAVARCLDDANPWVRLAAAGRIMEHCVPKGSVDAADIEPAIVFPPGTTVQLIPPEIRDAIAEAARELPALVPAKARDRIAAMARRPGRDETGDIDA
jgi:hypothetical protein